MEYIIGGVAVMFVFDLLSLAADFIGFCKRGEYDDYDKKGEC